MEVDHIVPSSQGGSNTYENKVCACPHCNAEKADKSVAKFVAGMSPRRRRAYQNRLETLYMQDKLSMDKWNLLDPLVVGEEEEPERPDWPEWEEEPVCMPQRAFPPCYCRMPFLWRCPARSWSRDGLPY